MLVLTLALLGTAEAATLQVCPTCNHTTIGSALNLAHDGDTIRVADGTYTESLVIDKDLEIVSVDGSELTTINGSANPMINVQPGKTFRLEGFTLEAPGNLRVLYATDDADVTVVDVQIEGVTGNLTGQCGRFARSKVTIRDSSFVDCDGGTEGGALYFDTCEVEVSDTIFAENQAGNDGAAIYGLATDLVVSGSSFSANRTSFDGGAISITDGSLTVADSTFVGNDVGRNGGAIEYSGPTATITTSTFEGNRADEGGAVWIESATVDISGSTFDGNTATQTGGAVLVDTSNDQTVADSLFVGNLAGGDGGGFASVGGSLGDTIVLDRNEFADNRANGDAGAVLLRYGGTKLLTGNVFARNEAVSGGALQLEFGDTTTSNGDLFCENLAIEGAGVDLVTETSATFEWAAFVENIASDQGGGVMVNATPATFENVDLVGNAATNEGGGILAAADVVVHDSLISSSPAGSGIYVDSGTTTATWSDFYDNNPRHFDGDLQTVPTDNLREDPMLMSFVAGDGCDADLRRHPDSPMIDGGDPATPDSDGTAADVGAFGPIVDEDADGYLLDDCDNADADVHPGATETCDGIDEDCNGIFDDGLTELQFNADRDGDGFGSATDVTTACAQPAQYVTDATDCDDTDRNISPTHVESCDGVDEDCDTVVDDSAWDAAVWRLDADGDGYGDEADPGVRACADEDGNGPDDRVSDDTDCDDGNQDVNPSGNEHCNGEDDNCDNLTDNNPVDGDWLYRDRDGDGYGDELINKRGCEEDEGWVHKEDGEGFDCDDTLAAVGPPVTFYRDADGDGFGNALIIHSGCEALEGFVVDATDCDDHDPNVTDSATWYPDADGDGWGVEPADANHQCDALPGHASQMGDCDDANAGVNPDATDGAGDGLDQDCDGEDGVADTDAPEDTDVEDTDVEEKDGCKGCQTGNAPSGFVWLSALAFATIARRRSGHRQA